MPADGQSALDALPSLTGTVTGRVLEGDAVRVVAGSEVRFKSDLIYFAHERVTTTDAAGAFTFSGSATTRVPVPLVPFTLVARVPGIAPPLSPVPAPRGVKGTS